MLEAKRNSLSSASHFSFALRCNRSSRSPAHRCSCARALWVTRNPRKKDKEGKRTTMSWATTSNHNQPPPRRHRPPRVVAKHVMDVPELVDDDLLNLLDWRSSSRFGLAIEDHLFLANVKASSSNSSFTDLFTVEYEEGPITSVAWPTNPNGILLPSEHRVAVGLNNGDVQLWDVSSRRLLRSFRGLHSGPVCSLSWHDENVLTSGGMDALVVNTDVRDLERLPRFRAHTGPVCALRWSPMGCGTRKLASGGSDGLVYVWDLRKGGDGRRRRRDLYDHRFNDHRGSTVRALSWCPTITHLLASGGGVRDPRVRFRNAGTGASLNSSVLVGSRVDGLAWSPDGNEFLSCGKKLTVMEYPSMEKLQEFSCSGSPIVSAAQSPEGGRLVTLFAREKKLVLWNTFGIYHKTSIRQIPAPSFSKFSNTSIRK